MTFLPQIVEKSFTFLGNLDHFATTDRSFSLIDLTGNLTFDIITSVTMDVDFGAQRIDQRSEFPRIYNELCETYASEQMDVPWFFTPYTEWKRRQLAKRVRRTLTPIVQNAWANRKRQGTRSRRLLFLCLGDDVATMTHRVNDEACDQLSTFLLAGHDTTSILLSWMFYELSRTPHAMTTLRNELDDLFGSGQWHRLRLILMRYCGFRLIPTASSILERVSD